MIGPLAMLWLALLCPPTVVGEVGVSPPGVEPVVSSPGLDFELAWERPARSPRDARPAGHPFEPIPATESETEQEESGGEDGEGLATASAAPGNPADSSPPAIRPTSSPPGRPRRPVTRLRC
ncbi:hypothetical protein [Tautonia plasticadhaerens]|uniref:Uncharacterized protein n=1 Tax=Tautonia plasticadhaerens TaxID=2527974 RepID=A0A518GUR6_9BACT|nr:hypothetical protein [Tautonia plasticadhaerens]QDV32321.1 hypothetical protein ElP_01490 [Tautonia plasticadhaerens]